VGTDYAMWALITVKPKILPTSRRNRCPHQSVFGAHIHWNHLPTSTGIRTPEGRARIAEAVKRRWAKQKAATKRNGKA
jgi:hypothetical protein